MVRGGESRGNTESLACAEWDRVPGMVRHDHKREPAHQGVQKGSLGSTESTGKLELPGGCDSSVSGAQLRRHTTEVPKGKSRPGEKRGSNTPKRGRVKGNRTVKRIHYASVERRNRRRVRTEGTGLAKEMRALNKSNVQERGCCRKIKGHPGKVGLEKGES